MRSLTLLLGLCLASCSFAQEPKAGSGSALPKAAKARLGSQLFRSNVSYRNRTLTPDGQFVVLLNSNNTQLDFMSVTTGQIIKNLKLKEQVQTGYGINYSNSGKHILIAAYNTATVIDATSGEVTGKLMNSGNNQPFAKKLQSLNDGNVTISASGQQIAFGTRYPQQTKECNAYVYDFVKKDFIFEEKVLQSQYIQAVLSSDGKKLATFGQYYVRQKEENVAPILQVWDVATKKELKRIKTNTAQVTAAVFSPDGKTVYSSGQNGPVEAWDTATGTIRNQFVTRSNVGQKLFLSADGERLAATSNDGSGAVQVWDTKSGKRIAVSFAPANSVDEVVFPKGQPALALGTYFQTIQLWTMPGELITPQNGHFGSVNQIEYTPDGKEILSIGQDGRVIRWDRKTLNETASYGYSNQALRNRSVVKNPVGADVNRVNWPQRWNVYNGVFSPDYQSIYVPGNSGLAHVNLENGQEEFTLFLPGSRNSSIQSRASISADGRRISASGQHYERNKYIHTAVAWDTETGRTLAEHRKELESNVAYINASATVVSSDGNYFGVVSHIQDQRNGQAFLEYACYDLRDGRQISLSSQKERSTSPNLLAAPDQRSAIVLDQQKKDLLVWDLPTGKRSRTIHLDVNGMNQQAIFDPTGRLVAIPVYTVSDPNSGRTRHGIHVVEWASGELRFEIEAGLDSITSMAFSPDGKELAIGSSDSTIHLYDATGEEKTRPWLAKSTNPDQLWKTLETGNSRTAWLAIQELTHRQDIALKLIRDSVKPVEPPALPSDMTISKLIGSLDAPAFAERESAMKKLKDLGPLVEKPLREAIETTPSPETRERIEKLLGLINKPLVPNAMECRVVEILERIGTSDAQAELSRLASGDASSGLTIDAKRALARLTGK